MKLDVFTTPEVFSHLEADWNTLVQHSTANQIFLTREWQQAWWQAYHPGELLVITARTDDGTLAGIAPWFISIEGDERVIRAVGCVDVTDYLEIIVHPDHADAFWDALAAHLAGMQETFTRLELCNIPENSGTLTQFPAFLQKHGFNTQSDVKDVCPIIPLPESWDDYLANLTKKQRHEVRRKLRRAGQNVDWYTVDATHDLQAATETFFDLMAKSSEEKAVFLQNEQHAAFFRDMIPRMHAQGWLQLIFLTVDGEPAAAYLNFDYNDRILVYNSGQDVERFGAISPGIVLLARSIGQAIEEGRTEFDFLRGNETYKYQMGGQDTQVYRLAARTQ